MAEGPAVSLISIISPSMKLEIICRPFLGGGDGLVISVKKVL